MQPDNISSNSSTEVSQEYAVDVRFCYLAHTHHKALYQPRSLQNLRCSFGGAFILPIVYRLRRERSFERRIVTPFPLNRLSPLKHLLYFSCVSKRPALLVYAQITERRAKTRRKWVALTDIRVMCALVSAIPRKLWSPPLYLMIRFPHQSSSL